MKFVHGKRQIHQELLWGFVLVTESVAGVRTIGFIFGRRVWGFQWRIKKKKSNAAFARSSAESNPNIVSKSSSR